MDVDWPVIQIQMHWAILGIVPNTEFLKTPKNEIIKKENFIDIKLEAAETEKNTAWNHTNS